jgi:hypothetical protein
MVGAQSRFVAALTENRVCKCIKCYLLLLQSSLSIAALQGRAGQLKKILKVVVSINQIDEFLSQYLKLENI